MAPKPFSGSIVERDVDPMVYFYLLVLLCYVIFRIITMFLFRLFASLIILF